MKINWKIVLVFVLILALLGPVYSKAIETEQSTSPEQPVEPVVEEDVKETPEKKKRKQNLNQSQKQNPRKQKRLNQKNRRLNLAN
ncbi:hypothetical protein [Listeria innocua]|uniref:hypothetical protein n=1 Tax=Listeria innocua TaxID=1642 RepID=UPI001F27E1BC|nr:hypothetical protein [Listeria innocua]